MLPGPDLHTGQNLEPPFRARISAFAGCGHSADFVRLVQPAGAGAACPNGIILRTRQFVIATATRKRSRVCAIAAAWICGDQALARQQPYSAGARRASHQIRSRDP